MTIAEEYDINSIAMEAIEGHDVFKLQTWLKTGHLNVRTKLPNGETFLHKAVQAGNLLTVALLVNHGADLNATTPHQFDETGHLVPGQTALGMAIAHPDKTIANYLIQQGAKDIPAIDVKAENLVASPSVIEQMGIRINNWRQRFEPGYVARHQPGL